MSPVAPDPTLPPAAPPEPALPPPTQTSQTTQTSPPSLAPRPGICLHQLFESRVAEAPDAIAAVAAVAAGEEDGRCVSYHELNARADRLARALRRRGVGAEVTVGIYLDHGLELLVALLGILKAGGAYVPLDRRHPEERLRHIAADAGLAAVVTRPALAGPLRPLQLPCMDVDAPEGDAGEEGGDPEPGREPSPLSLAYVLYTSGSTGRPKGVLTPHETLVHLYFAWESAYELRTRATIQAQIAAFSFAVFQADWIRALGSGGTLVLCPPEVLLEPATLAAVLFRQRVRFAELVPAVLRPLVRHLVDSGERLPDMEMVVVGSDRWYLREHREIPAAFGPRTQAVHSFGLTETSIDTAYFLGSELDLPLDRMAPIGRPFPGVRVSILDEALRPVTAGDTGQLVIGGAGVTRGLLGRPELTAERFMPDALSPEPGARCYLTGDQARVLADGNIEFLGRGDSQVKIRGFRVELGEIETALKSVPGVAEAVAAVRDGAEEAQLVAYVVPRDGARLTAGPLRRRLHAALPDYMMPGAFVLLDRLPLTSSAKVDRRSLPAPAADNLVPDDGKVAPRNPTEGVLAALWSRLLGVEEVSVEESFFQMGGHSLLAARLMARVRDAFGVDLGVRDLFEAPTVAALAERVERARAEGRLAGDLALAPAGRDRRLPLSFAQQRLWFFEQMHPGSATYILTARLPLAPDATPELLEEVCAEIVRRHESLRTTFVLEDGLPVQRVGPPFRPTIEVLDGVMGRPFDLEAGPLFRFALARPASGVPVLGVAMHHIISDAWSLGVLQAEVEALTAAFKEGEPSPLPELPIQYADFAVWQRQVLQGAELDRQLAYWKQRLAGAPALLELPADRPRPAVESHRGATRLFLLPAERSAAVSRLALEEGATTFMVLLAAFYTLLYRLTGVADLPVGCAVANRPRPELEGLIGFFTNTLVLRGDLEGEPSFRELVGRVRSEVLAAFGHQDLPFERLVEELRPERNASHHPLFQVMFVVQNAPGGATAPPELPPGPLPGTTKFDLMLQATETPHGLLTAWEYSTDLFDHATIERFAAHFGTLLRAALEEPDASAGALRLLEPAEERRLVVDWNASPAPPPREGCVHERFAAVATYRPWAPALVWGEREITYGVLRRQARGLARRLEGLGVGPEVRVGICCDRTPGMVAAILAVLEAGGAYVPLDPAYPRTRLDFMLRDSGARVVIAPPHHAALVPDDGPRLLVLDEDEEIAGEALPGNRGDRTLASGATGRNLAVVIYTSGSTGVPKGVALEHRGILALEQWSRLVFAEQALDGVLASTSICFDLSIFEILVTLLRGGRVVLADNALHLPGLPARDSVTLINTVPSAMTELLRLGAVPRSARVVCLAGEALSGALVDRIAGETAARDVYNLYGPTEETVYATAARTLPRQTREPVIGRPLDHTRVYLLDRRLAPVPVGVLGEIHLAGPKLSRGYLGRPGLTAERFVPDPFHGGGERMYRTGDLGRSLPDGRIEFAGRTDQQVKLRGFRIELAEVEAVLRAHPEVAGAAVGVRGNESGARLVAWIESRGAEVTAAHLRQHLRERLAAHMVPSVFLQLDALPRTPNGKIDRGRLPEPRPEPRDNEREREDGFAAVRSEAEQRVAEAWAEVLDVGEIGADDDFFELGGHSLLATRVLARLHELCGVTLAVKDLFEARTVRALAGRVEAAQATGGEARGSAAVRRVSRDRRLPLSHAQQRLWLFEQMHPGSPVYLMSAVLPLPPGIEPEVVGRALAGIVSRHEILRTTFAAEDGKPYQRIGRAFRPELELAGPEPLSPERLEEVLAAQMSRPFDLERGPLFRAVLARTTGGEAQLLVVLHHIVADGWSLGILQRELTVLCAAIRAGRPSPLPDLEVQYADYAAWVREVLPARVLEEQLAGWRDRLAGAPALLELPTDRPRPPVPTFRGATRVDLVPAELAERTRDLAARAGVTPFMALLAAFDALLHRLTGAGDLPVGCAVANRPRPELEPLIGFFANTLVLRTGLSGALTFADLLARVRETVLHALAHQDVPFERLVEDLRPERSQSYQPLFQVMFVLQNERAQGKGGPAGPPPAIPGEPLRRFHKFDLTLNVADTPHGLLAAWEYLTDLFDDATVVRFAGHFRRLLAGAVEDPRRQLGDLALLTDEERRQIVEGWNETHRPGDGLLIHQRIAEVARLHPELPALRFGDRELSYGDLVRRAGHLAARLRRLGVGPEARVGICGERSPEMIVGLLAVLAAGGAFVPLDPGYPEVRLAHIVEDADCRVLLAGPGLERRLPGAGRVVVELAPDIGDGPDGGSFDAGVGDDNLAYLIYTSGTTGQPKGTMIVHRGVRNVVLAEAELFGVQPGDRVLQLASFSFDASVYEVLLALDAGATLYLAARDQLLPGPALERFVAEHGIDTVVITPSALSVLDPAAVELRRLIVVGEAFPQALAHQWGAKTATWNAYGPTEATIWATTARVDGTVRPPIGVPIANVRVHVVDRRLEPVPVGVAGELVIGGVGVSRGYLHQPALTAERFVPDPFGAPGERLYRSGDLARYLPDGTLEYLGRADRQTKLRGYRIELSEIQSALVQVPGVREAAVVVREDEPGQRRLVAYLVLAEGGELDADGMRRHLEARLPDFMMPGAFLRLAELPRTPTGKLDEEALPRPERALSGDEPGDLRPRTPIEEALVAIWEEILGQQGIRRNDSFFELGGHSLLAGRVFARIWEMLGVSLNLTTLFRSPVLSDLAYEVQAALSGGGLAAPDRILRRPRSEAAPLSYPQLGLWFADRIHRVPGGGAVNNLYTEVALPATADPALLQRALAEVVRRHEALRTRFVEDGGTPLQVVEEEATVAIEPIDLRDRDDEAANAEARRLALAVACTPFDLARAPLARAVLLRLPGGRQLLCLAVHHIVADGWSLGILLRELHLLYEALSQGRPPALPDLPIQYADYAAWQQRRHDAYAPHLEHWRRRLAGAPPLFELPFARPRPEGSRRPGAMVTFAVGPEVSQGLRTLARERRLTLFMVLLAGFQALLHRVTGATDFVLCTDTANRERRETEGLIGLFLNQVVLRADLSGGPTFADLLDRVRRETLDALAHQSLPFELLVRELQPERELRHPPVAQIKLNLQNLPGGIRQGSAVRPGEPAGPDGDGAEPAPIAANLDLTVFLSDEEDGLRGTLVYNADLYDTEPMRRLAADYGRVLEEMVRAPGAPCGTGGGETTQEGGARP